MAFIGSAFARLSIAVAGCRQYDRLRTATPPAVSIPGCRRPRWSLAARPRTRPPPSPHTRPVRIRAASRSFFATLKEGTESGSLQRLFITGVSPITMDDVTSGFNIGANISLSPKFNDLLGFTEAEVRGVLRMYRDLGAFDQDVDAALALMREWYDGYRFSEDAENDVYNTDMVLCYLKDSVPDKPGPRDLIDTNVRIDYGKLRHLLVVNRELAGASTSCP